MEYAKWIWENEEDHADEYVRFYKTFSYHGGKIQMDLSCDSNYELYINGQIAGFGQYADYPYDKVFDRIDITPYCREGGNTLTVLVWYYGRGFFTYYKGLPGLIWEIREDDKVIAYSDRATLCRKPTDYLSGRGKIITYQLGFSFTYDAAGYDGFLNTDFLPQGYQPAVEVAGRPENLRIRPIHKFLLKTYREAVLINSGRRIYDLGEETVGYLSLMFRAAKGTSFMISYSEHLIEDENGTPDVPRIIENRDFSVEILGSGEWCSFSNYLRRLGCRYLQVNSDTDVEINSIGLHPAEYPVEVLAYKASTPLRQKIYDVCIHTLRCCMFEHYEDCPWREQSLYTLDSRHQMLCGYYAFKEYAFARASLDLIGNGRREDHLLYLCAPSDINLVIPSFALFYLVQMKEYMQYSGDLSLAESHFDRMQAILEAFLCQEKDGLVPNFRGDSYWNFYEWNESLQGDRNREQVYFDLPLNALLSIALQNMAWMADRLHKAEYANRCRLTSAKCNDGINKTFRLKNDILYRDTADGESASELGNSLAILCGAADSETSSEICTRMADEEGMIPATLSMKAFKYDSMLQTDQNKYSDWVLKDIDRNYGSMLDTGSTSFWETLKGAEDFNQAGSLCHGWSAIPVIYYHRLEKQ